MPPQQGWVQAARQPPRILLEESEELLDDRGCQEVMWCFALVPHIASHGITLEIPGIALPPVLGAWH